MNKSESKEQSHIFTLGWARWMVGQHVYYRTSAWTRCHFMGKGKEEEAVLEGIQTKNLLSTPRTIQVCVYLDSVTAEAVYGLIASRLHGPNFPVTNCVTFGQLVKLSVPVPSSVKWG